MTGLLHFSDIHNNQVALEKVFLLCKAYKEYSVAITGDVCSTHSPFPYKKYDELPNPWIGLVPGNHDIKQLDDFARMKKARWETPYFSQLKDNVAIVGFNGETDIIDYQMRNVKCRNRGSQKALFVLHHRPYSQKVRKRVARWARENFPNLMSLILLHGHEHNNDAFFSDIQILKINGLNVFVSHVYSANVKHLKGMMAGCANLFIVQENGQVIFSKVVIPGEPVVKIIPVSLPKPVPVPPPKPKIPKWQVGSCVLCRKYMLFENFRTHLSDCLIENGAKATNAQQKNTELLWVPKPESVKNE